MPRGWSWGKIRKSGYRSGLEETVAQTLTDKCIPFEYESVTFYYDKTVPKGKCLKCGNNKVVSVRRYTPDFVINDNNLIIEVKGRLTSVDRTKLVAVKASNPSLKLVIYLGADNRLQKNSDKRYSDWCREKGFDFSINAIPRRWLSKRSAGNS